METLSFNFFGQAMIRDIDASMRQHRNLALLHLVEEKNMYRKYPVELYLVERLLDRVECICK